MIPPPLWRMIPSRPEGPVPLAASPGADQHAVQIALKIKAASIHFTDQFFNGPSKSFGLASTSEGAGWEKIRRRPDPPPSTLAPCPCTRTTSSADPQRGSGVPTGTAAAPRAAPAQEEAHIEYPREPSCARAPSTPPS